MKTQHHIITKAELLEMLKPFNDHDRIAVKAVDVIIDLDTKKDDDGKITGVDTVTGTQTLYIGGIVPLNDTRVPIALEAFVP